MVRTRGGPLTASAEEGFRGSNVSKNGTQPELAVTNKVGSWSDKGQECTCTWTPAALMWPWDPDQPGYRFPGHTAPLRGVSSYPSACIWPRLSTNLYLKGIIALFLCIRPGHNLHHTRQSSALTKDQFRVFQSRAIICSQVPNSLQHSQLISP